MTIFLVLKCVAFMAFAISDSAILTRPSDVSSCVGKNVTIGWEYDNPANLLTATWTFDNGTLYDILRKVLTGTPAVQPSSQLNIEFIENGTIKLIDPLSSYTGKYDLSLAYSSGSPDSDSVDIVIYDVPQSLMFQENVTNHTFTCSGSSSIPTVIRVGTSDGNVRYETSPFTSSVTTEGIECCYNGSAASCSNEKFTATYGNIYCQQVREASSTQTTTTIPTTTASTTSTSTRITTESVNDTIPITTTHSPALTTVKDAGSGSNHVVLLAVGLSLGGTVILIVVIAAVVCCMRRQRNNKKQKENPLQKGSTSNYHMGPRNGQRRGTNERQQTAEPLGRATPNQRNRGPYITSSNYFRGPDLNYAHGRQYGSNSSRDKGDVREGPENRRQLQDRHHGLEPGSRRNPMYVEEMRPATVDQGTVFQYHDIGNSVRYTPLFNHAYNYY